MARAVCSLCSASVPVRAVACACLPSTGHPVASRGGRRLRLPDSIATWSFIEGVTLDGLFIFGLSLYAQTHLGESGVLAAGVLMAVRYLSEMLFSPSVGAWPTASGRCACW